MTLSVISHVNSRGTGLRTAGYISLIISRSGRFGVARSPANNGQGHGINIRAIAAQLRDLVAKFFVAPEAAIHRVQAADHAGENRVAQSFAGGFAIRRRAGAGMNRREKIRFFRPDGEGPVTAVRIAHDENFVGIHIAEK